MNQIMILKREKPGTLNTLRWFIKIGYLTVCLPCSCRRLYPVISVSFEDLHPRHFYVVMVDFVSVDNFKYRFEVKSNSWVTAKKKTDLGCPRMYTHPETPASGASLMMNGLTFQKLKLTNSLKLSLKDTKVSEQLDSGTASKSSRQ